MKVNPNKNTQINKPDTGTSEPLAPQIPDNNRPDLGRPIEKLTESKGSKKVIKK